MRQDALKEKNINLEKSFNDLKNSNSLLKKKFENATQISKFKGSGLFLGTQKRKISGNGFMIIGDAAGLIDLISANGIPQGMLSGKLAALQAIKCIEENNYSAEFIQPYSIELYKNIKSDLSIGRLLNPVLRYRIVHKTAMTVLNLIANNSGKRSAITDLFYSKNPVLNFINPLFYFRLGKEYFVK